jgi:endonuclease/exonuclease/phosphatase family metal-dependent hydrolase
MRRITAVARRVIVAQGRFSAASKCVSTLNAHLQWSRKKHSFEDVASFKVASFNLLAPCFKRMDTRDEVTGDLYREDFFLDRWTTRQAKLLEFFNRHLVPTTDIIGVQELWLDDRYARPFEKFFAERGYRLESLARTGEKRDAVGLLVKKSEFDIISRDDIVLGQNSDRVALLLLLYHRRTRKYFLCVNTHLSFPHNIFDQLNQVNQMVALIDRMKLFAESRDLRGLYSSIIIGDFNVEADSSVCDRLRKEGFVSSFEVAPPKQSKHLHLHASQPGHAMKVDKFVIPDSFSTTVDDEEKIKVVYPHYVSHKNHRNEEVGVDHIFVRPEQCYEEDANLEAFLEMEPDTDNEDRVPALEEYENIVVSSSVPAVTRFVPKSIYLFVNECTVVPQTMEADAWDYSFNISDHRPVLASFVFGVKR